MKCIVINCKHFFGDIDITHQIASKNTQQSCVIATNFQRITNFGINRWKHTFGQHIYLLE